MNNYRKAKVNQEQFENIHLAFEVLLSDDFKKEKYQKIKASALQYAKEREDLGWDDVEVVETMIYNTLYSLRVEVNFDGGRLKIFFHTSYSGTDIYISELPKSTPFGNEKDFYNRHSSKEHVECYKLFKALVSCKKTQTDFEKLKIDFEDLKSEYDNLKKKMI